MHRLVLAAFAASLALLAGGPGLTVEGLDPALPEPLAPLAAPRPPELPPVGLAPDLPPVGALPEVPEAPAAPEEPSPAALVAPPVLAGVGAVAVLHAFGAWRWLALGAMGLYSRISRDDLLGSQTRDRVYKLVQASPGVALTQVVRETGLGWGTVVYHLDRLERAGFVSSERHGSHRCFFPAGGVPREARRGIGALKQDTTRSVAQLVAERPGVSQAEVCDALGLTASAASKQVSKLESAGLVRRERDWKTVRLHPLPGLAGLVRAPA